MDPITLALLVLLICVIFGVGPWWPRTRGWGYNPMMILLIIVVVILLLRHV